METYQVPQFIEEESKLVGPFSFTQIFILVGAGAIALIVYNIFPKIIGVPIVAIIAFATFLIVFTRANDMPLYKMIIPMVKHLILPKQYLWKQARGNRSALPKKENTIPKYTKTTTNINTSNINIKELSKSLDKGNE